MANVEAISALIDRPVDAGLSQDAYWKLIASGGREDWQAVLKEERAAFTTKPPETLPVEVDADELLGITEEIGLQCAACKKRDVKYVLVQSRSADEGMTANCECRSCGHRFRLRV